MTRLIAALWLAWAGPALATTPPPTVDSGGTGGTGGTAIGSGSAASGGSGSTTTIPLGSGSGSGGSGSGGSGSGGSGSGSYYPGSGATIGENAAELSGDTGGTTFSCSTGPDAPLALALALALITAGRTRRTP